VLKPFLYVKAPPLLALSFVHDSKINFRRQMPIARPSLALLPHPRTAIVRKLLGEAKAAANAALPATAAGCLHLQDEARSHIRRPPYRSSSMCRRPPTSSSPPNFFPFLTCSSSPTLFATPSTAWQPSASLDASPPRPPSPSLHASPWPRAPLAGRLRKSAGPMLSRPG